MARSLAVLVFIGVFCFPVSGFGQALSIEEYSREFIRRVVEPYYIMFGLRTLEEIEARKEKDKEKNQAHIEDTLGIATSEFYSNREMMYRIFRKRCAREGKLYIKVNEEERWVNRKKKKKPKWWSDPRKKKQTF